MEILIINQHTSNRGDEAAGKALVRKLIKEKNIEKIHIIYSAAKEIREEEKFCRDIKSGKIINYGSFSNLSLLEKLFVRLPLFIPFKIEKKIVGSIKTPNLFPILEKIEKVDKVINAPGGVNLGPYMDTKYLWRLFNSVHQKDTAVYSISFGPFFERNFFEKRFKKISVETLKKAKFLSLRDKQSQIFAQEYGISYIPSIDTAFLDEYYEKKLPDDLNYLKNKEYVVFVPNQLYNWHVFFKNMEKHILDKFYLKIMDFFLKKRLTIVMIPQLYGQLDDYNYFLSLRKQLDNENIYVIDKKHNSDIQQLIIRNAIFLIGARYHSIIFAIRNNVPFVSLSYEHKMSHTLELLNLTDLNIELKDVVGSKKDQYILEHINDLFENRQSYKEKISKASLYAKNIAERTYEKLKEDFLFKK